MFQIGNSWSLTFIIDVVKVAKIRILNTAVLMNLNTSEKKRKKRKKKPTTTNKQNNNNNN